MLSRINNLNFIISVNRLNYESSFLEHFSVICREFKMQPKPDFQLPINQI